MISKRKTHAKTHSTALEFQSHERFRPFFRYPVECWVPHLEASDSPFSTWAVRTWCPLVVGVDIRLVRRTGETEVLVYFNTSQSILFVRNVVFVDGCFFMFFHMSILYVDHLWFSETSNRLFKSLIYIHTFQ